MEEDPVEEDPVEDPLPEPEQSQDNGCDGPNEGMENGSCVLQKQTAQSCADAGFEFDSDAGYCYGSGPECPEGAEHGCDADYGTDRGRHCESVFEFATDDGCRIKHPEEDERSEGCPEGMGFYSQVGCADPCPGALLVDGACHPVGGDDPTPPPPPPPGTPPPPPPPPSCPIGYDGTPPNCTAGTPEIYVLATAVAEGDGTVSVTVALSHAGTADATVDVSTADGTATAGSDYTAVTSRSVTIAAGARTATVPVTILDDSAHESDETFTVTVSNAAGGAELGTNPSADVTITDNDLPSLSITGPAAAANEGATLTYTVSLSRPTGHTGVVSVDYAASSPTATEGTTCGSVDYAIVEGTLSWAGSDSAARSVVVDACEDSTHPEASETVTVTLANPAGALLPATPSADGTITSVAPVTSPVTGLTLQCTASGSSFNLRATWNQTANYQYRYRFNNSGAWSYAFWGSATLNGVAAGTHTVSVQRASQPNTGADSLYFQGVPTTSVSTVCAAQKTLSVSDVTVDESAGTADFTIVLSQAATNTVTVRAATSNGTGTGHATAGSDYTAVDRTFVITPGQTSAIVQVQITDDTDDESDETFTLTLSSPTGATLDTTADSATGTITDDDVTPEISIAAASAAESSTITFDLTLDVASPLPVWVTARTAATSPLSAAGATACTATDGSQDYVTRTRHVVFAANITTASFTVTLCDDIAVENVETFTVVLSSPAYAVIASGAGTATGTITDNDRTFPEFLS